ncbi:B3 DNA binding domain-containing protein [Hirschfeldia incana]|nr:B3 DNA binding domain-containing protein [Hirschfeldia incana]
MAYDKSLHSPNNPHFFQPLLPSFHTHLNIPVAFFLKHFQGSNDHIKTAKLTTDASDKTWLVKINGLKLTDGWEDFAVANDLRIGDIIIFRHEGEMVFHVIAFGPSCCDIQYISASSHNINNDNDDQTNNTVTENSSGEKRKRVKKNPRTNEDSSSDHSQFVAHVSPSSLSCDRLYIPKGFARSNGLDSLRGEEIILLNEEGRSWNLNMTNNESGMHTFVRPGWRRFCAENGMKKGHHYTFKLVRKSAPPVLRLSPAEHDQEPAPVSESSLHHSYYVGSVSSSSLRVNKLYLQREFVTANGLDRGCSEITVKNDLGGSWILPLRRYESHNNTYLGPGWRTFCQVNGIKAGDPFMFKVVETGDRPVLLLCSSNRGKTPLECSEDSDDVHSLSSDTSSEDGSKEESRESDKERIEDEESSLQCIVMDKEKSSLRCICSSQYSKHRFVRITLTLSALKTSLLYLPLAFTRMNCINKPRKIMLLGKDGVEKQVVDLLKNKSNGNMRIGKGWKELCDAHGVKVGESFLLELIWEDKEAIPVLKFCTTT